MLKRRVQKEESVMRKVMINLYQNLTIKAMILMYKYLNIQKLYEFKKKSNF